jgi:hypothetical protein
MLARRRQVTRDRDAAPYIRSRIKRLGVRDTTASSPAVVSKALIKTAMMDAKDLVN